MASAKDKAIANAVTVICVWAYMEAAQHAKRHCESIRRWHQRKHARKHPVVAIKAVAHKLSRACYHIMQEGTTFDVTRAFH